MALAVLHHFGDLDSPYNFDACTCVECSDSFTEQPLKPLLFDEADLCSKKCLEKFESRYKCKKCTCCSRSQFVTECWQDDESRSFCSDICLDRFS